MKETKLEVFESLTASFETSEIFLWILQNSGWESQLSGQLRRKYTQGETGL